MKTYAFINNSLLLLIPHPIYLKFDDSDTIVPRKLTDFGNLTGLILPLYFPVNFPIADLLPGFEFNLFDIVGFDIFGFVHQKKL